MAGVGNGLEHLKAREAFDILVLSSLLHRCVVVCVWNFNLYNYSKVQNPKLKILTSWFLTATWRTDTARNQSKIQNASPNFGFNDHQQWQQRQQQQQQQQQQTTKDKNGEAIATKTNSTNSNDVSKIDNDGLVPRCIAGFSKHCISEQHCGNIDYIIRKQMCFQNKESASKWQKNKTIYIYIYMTSWPYFQPSLRLICQDHLQVPSGFEFLMDN